MSMILDYYKQLKKFENAINVPQLTMKIGRTLANRTTRCASLGSWTFLLRSCTTWNNYPHYWGIACICITMVYSNSN